MSTPRSKPLSAALVKFFYTVDVGWCENHGDSAVRIEWLEIPESVADDVEYVRKAFEACLVHRRHQLINVSSLRRVGDPIEADHARLEAAIKTREENAKKATEERERKEYERLKNKFEGRPA